MIHHFTPLNFWTNHATFYISPVSYNSSPPSSSLLGAAVVAAARRSFGLGPVWPELLQVGVVVSWVWTEALNRLKHLPSRSCPATQSWSWSPTPPCSWLTMDISHPRYTQPTWPAMRYREVIEDIGVDTWYCLILGVLILCVLDAGISQHELQPGELLRFAEGGKKFLRASSVSESGAAIVATAKSEQCIVVYYLSHKCCTMIKIYIR